MRLRAVTAATWADGTLDWCVARRRGTSIELGPKGRLPDAPPPGPADDGAETFRRLGAERSIPLALLLPARHALLRILDLPGEDPEELAAMAALQMVKLSPFPAEETLTAIENLDPDRKPARILAVAVRRDAAERLLTAAQQAGRTVSRIDLDILAWWRVLRDSGNAGDTGRTLHLRLHADELWILVCSDGQPELFRVLEGPFADEQELSADLAYALAALGMERGSSPPTRCLLWTDGEEDARRLSAALPADGPAGKLHRNDELPGLVEGLARRSIEGRGITLVPADWAERQRRRHQSRGLLKGAILLLAAWLVAIVGMTAAVAIRRARLARSEANLSGIETPAAEVRALIELTRTLEDYADRSRSSIEALREAVRLLPDGVTLTQFSYVKGRGITVTGEAAEAESIYEYLGRLETSTLFATVRPENVTSRGEAGASVSQFRVSAELRGEPL